MAGLIEYECPCCGGRIEFDSGLQKLKCPYCDSVFDIETVQNYTADIQNTGQDEMNWDTQAGGENSDMRVYTCQSCGGEIIADSTTGASKCPYCDNPVVMTGSFSGDLKPDYIIPFKLDKDAAKAALSKHLSGKRLLPKQFSSENHINEIKGVYVPVWLFDAEADANMVYRAEKRNSWSDSNYHYVETSYYSAVRAGKIAFELVPVDGSEKMDDDLMESIEPFDFKDAVDFRTAYLAGYLADRYDVSAEQSIERANSRIKKSTEAAFAGTVTGYSAVKLQSGSVRLNNGKAKYALYPVWILNTTWNGEKYTFAMNGQTGKFVGDLPVDMKAASMWFALITAIVTAVLYGLSFLLQ